MNSTKLMKQANVILAVVFFCVSVDGTHEVRSETNKMLLMLPSLLAKKKTNDLSGYWYYTHNGYELNMSQNGDQLSATYINLRFEQ